MKLKCIKRIKIEIQAEESEKKTKPKLKKTLASVFYLVHILCESATKLRMFLCVRMWNVHVFSQKINLIDLQICSELKHKTQLQSTAATTTKKKQIRLFRQ